MNKQELHNLVKELLTLYNDNFVSEPCDEIVEDVIEEMDETDKVDSSTVAEAVDRIMEEFFE